MNNKVDCDYDAKINQLTNDLKNREFEIKLLSEISQTVNQQFNLQTLLDLVAKRAQDLVQAKTLLIPLLNEDRTEYTYKAGYGENTEEIIGESLPINYGICGWVWKHKKIWWQGVLDELEEDEKNSWEKEAGSVLIVPLFGKRSFLGGIAAIDKIDLGDFSRRDMELLSMFATQVTTAIENSIYFEEMIAEKNKSESLQKELEVINQGLENIIEDRTTSLRVTNKALEDSLSSLHETQSQLINSEKMASLGGLVAGISHEINTPVGISITSASHIEVELKSITDKLQSNNMKKSDLESSLEICQKGVNILTRNLRTASDLIRSFKQVAVDQSSNEFRDFNLKEYVDEVILSLHPKLKITNIRTINQIEESINIYTNPGSLSQILTNLILNSSIHAFQVDNISDNNNEIIVDAKLEDNILNFNYRDNGQGLDKETLDKIFDPFFTTKRGQGGSGLGMSIVFNLVSSLEGTIEANSTPGKGVDIKIRIPIKKK